MLVDFRTITVEQIRELRRVGAIDIYELMVAIHSADADLRNTARSHCASVFNAREIERQEQERERHKSDLAGHNTD